MLTILKNLTPVQQLLLIVAVTSYATSATAGAQFADLFGVTVAHFIITGASLLGGLVATVLLPMTGQSAQIKAVTAMPGVDKIVANANANPTLAQLAIDPAQDKIEVAAGAQQIVASTAKGGT